MSEQGERGKTGDTGPRGQVGRQGEPGEVGAGERGPTGDHGQDGEAGARGPRGIQSPVVTRAMLALFLVVVLGFTFLAYRTDRAQRQISRNQHRIEALIATRNEAIAARRVTDLKFCTTTQTAFNAIRDVIATGVKQLEAQHPTDPAAQALRAQQIKTSQALLLKLQPVQCPP